MKKALVSRLKDRGSWTFSTLYLNAAFQCLHVLMQNKTKREEFLDLWLLFRIVVFLWVSLPIAGVIWVRVIRVVWRGMQDWEAPLCHCCSVLFNFILAENWRENAFQQITANVFSSEFTFTFIVTIIISVLYQDGHVRYKNSINVRVNPEEDTFDIICCIDPYFWLLYIYIYIYIYTYTYIYKSSESARTSLSSNTDTTF